MAEKSQPPHPAPPPSNQPFFHVEKLYLKDLSFENPMTPESFQQTEEPKVEFNLETGATQKGPEHYEVNLHVTVKVHIEEKVLFLVDVTYSGLFLLRNLPQDHMGPTLGIECPHILFPYLRRVISEMVTDGGFKPMVLDPINFSTLYNQARAKEQQPTSVQ